MASAPRLLAAICLVTLALSACTGGSQSGGGAPVDVLPPEVSAGERLFREARFAEFFAVHCGGQLNAPLATGDPVLDTTEVGGVLLPGPFAGQTMSCSACHMIDEGSSLAGGGVRSYCDFATRPAIPARPDGKTHAARNSPPLVNASIARGVPVFFHQDGEFGSLEALVLATLQGRNFGWLATESLAAEAHIAAVIRQDDGQGALAAHYGSIPYAELLDDGAVGVPERFLLPPQFRIDVATATDAQIVDAVAKLIAEYTRSLVFARDALDAYSGSPYDAFLAANGLPQAPAPGEPSIDYVHRLLADVDALANPVFVSAGVLSTHGGQPFEFGAVELEGLRTFLREIAPAGNGGAGNCAACHPPPDFTDFGFHNAGFSQDEYDAVHGQGAFLARPLPDLTTRNGDPDAWLPPSPSHPFAAGPFRAAVDPLDPSRMDLGQWNVFANPAFPGQQAALLASIDETWGAGTSGHATTQLLPLTEAVFKTPSLRDLGHSGPYGHAGNFATLDAVTTHYLDFAALAVQGLVRNKDPRLLDVQLVPADIPPLSSFLRALNEDVR